MAQGGRLRFSGLYEDRYQEEVGEKEGVTHLQQKPDDYFIYRRKHAKIGKQKIKRVVVGLQL